MQMKYAILRTTRPQTREVLGGMRRGSVFDTIGTVAQEVAVEVAMLGPRDVHDLARDPSVAAAAPAMPTKLIAPFPEERAVQIAWGIHAVGADESPFDGDGVVVAVLDTGIDRNHDAFEGMDLVEEDFSGDGNGDGNDHGTHCAGTVFGRDFDGIRIGIARGVKRALIGKVLKNDGSGSSDGIFRAIQWALDGGAKVISMSLGFDFPGMVKRLQEEGWPTELATSVALEAYSGNLRMFDAIMEVVEARRTFDGGAIIVAAAGNESRRDQNASFKIAASLPSAANGVVAVGALDATAERKYTVATFSNTMPETVAPGVGILSAKRDGALVSLSGTSMATPHVAGLAALWWQATRARAEISLNARNVLLRLLGSARADVFVAGVDVEDRGVGMVTAPRE